MTDVHHPQYSNHYSNQGQFAAQPKIVRSKQKYRNPEEERE